MELALNNNLNLTTIKNSKKEVIKELKNKLESAKLNLIYTELGKNNIPFEKKYTTISSLNKDLKNKLSGLNYNKVKSIIENVEKSLDGMISELEKGSTTAFTKLMTSNLSKTIAETLGISLAGRSALILAPTIGLKALVGTGIAGYSLYRVAKNRKEIIKTNENNELNNILSELEATKEGDKYIDTRFNEQLQKEIKNYLKTIGVKFEDTGYRALRQAIYSLDADKKKGLCNLLNIKLGKGIDIEKRISSVKKKLNVIAATTANVSVGATLGMQAANTINSIDPALAAGTLNGTFLGAWVEQQTNSTWFSKLSSSLGLIGTEVLQHLPIIGTFSEKIFAVENLATFCAIGATGGLITSAGLGIASVAKRIFNYTKNKKENKVFTKLDNEKYWEEDKIEMALIQKKLQEPSNSIETVIIDIILGYLKNEGINLGTTPKSINKLNSAIDSLSGDTKKKAKAILVTISDNINNNDNFISQLKQAGKISIGLCTSGLAIMSVYDILKSGTFLPELSQKLFPNNNIYTPIENPKGIDEKLSSLTEKDTINKSQKLYEELNNEKYLVEHNSDNVIDYGINYGQKNQGHGFFSDMASNSTSQYVVAAGTDMKFAENLLAKINIDISSKQMVPNITAICNSLDKLSPEELVHLYRYFYHNFDYVPTGENDIYNAVKEALSYSSYLTKATEYLHSFEKMQDLHNLISETTSKVGNTIIPFSIILETLGIVQKRKTNNEFGISNEELSEKNRNKLR